MSSYTINIHMHIHWMILEEGKQHRDNKTHLLSFLNTCTKNFQQYFTKLKKICMGHLAQYCHTLIWNIRKFQHNYTCMFKLVEDKEAAFWNQYSSMYTRAKSTITIHCSGFILLHAGQIACSFDGIIWIFFLGETKIILKIAITLSNESEQTLIVQRQQ